MGSPDGSKGAKEDGRYEDEAQHSVEIEKGFEMQATEVTQLQYFLVMNHRNFKDRLPSYFSKKEGCGAGNYKEVLGVGLCAHHPVEQVSWDDAREFIDRLNAIQDKYTYRLPTEAQWEYAARAGRPHGLPYPFGFNKNNELDDYGWYWNNSQQRSHAVASKKANQLGLYDMHGNVWEWTQDWYEKNYGLTDQELKIGVTDPQGPATGSSRVLRGGSWFNDARVLRSALRNSIGPGDRGSDVGFRLVRVGRK